ncbi:MAG TPA: methylenetetrahydrofolate reductase C-terminal domain-containing protein [Solirubrobacterales bacterium]|nr:methylenetetrahydrofolate reductase C-terminal domain-containing protein [Solirubrobacterales bacterium]
MPPERPATDATVAPPRRDGAWGKPSLRHLLTETDRFAVVVELVTSRGLITEERGRRVLTLARELAPQPRIDALSITDNPAGNAMLSADTIGTDLISRGQEVIIHLACKDWNRNALQSRAWKLSSEGFHNVLALSGDYPTGGYRGSAAPIFDLDSVGLLQMYSDMNEGAIVIGDGGAQFERTQFFLGATVTNHKRHEREVMPQYFKLRKKIAAGADFIINQIGYHARKDDELLRWMGLHGLRAPVLANVFVLSEAAARAFNSGRIPGVVVTDELYELVQRYSRGADRGRSFFLELAAKQVAIARGLGFRGAYLGGHLEAPDYAEVLDRADGFGPEDWRELARELQFPLPGEFHYFERDEETGMSSSIVNRAYEASRRKRRGRGAPLRYKLSRWAHAAAFEPGAPLHQRAGRLFAAIDEAPKPVRQAAHLVEQAVKVPMFGCQDCGDCSLPEIAYLCPESQCVKNERNGPCGGTRDGKCEVGDKDCIWALAYDRLKAYGEETTMLDGPVVIKDNALRGTSAWTNHFLGRDHQARQRAGADSAGDER